MRVCMSQNEKMWISFITLLNVSGRPYSHTTLTTGCIAVTSCTPVRLVSLVNYSGGWALLKDIELLLWIRWLLCLREGVTHLETYSIKTYNGEHCSVCLENVIFIHWVIWCVNTYITDSLRPLMLPVLTAMIGVLLFHSFHIIDDHKRKVTC